MSKKSSKFIVSKPVKKLFSSKNSSNTGPLYSGILSAQRAIQRQRYFESTQSGRFSQSKRESVRTITGVQENCDFPVIYHPWKSEHCKIFTREKHIKPMAKDPYTPMRRLISHAVESITTETECCAVLIPAEAVRIERVTIQQAPRRSAPIIVRYLRGNELMPSQRSIPSSTPVKVSLLPQSQYKTPTIPVMNSSRITDIVPTLATTNRFSNRAKTQTDPSVIRRPPRRLVLNVSHETIMPLSIYG